MKEKFKQAHMWTAFNYARMSYAVRLKVGCIVVKGDRILSIGYNGTPEGWDNACEDSDGKTHAFVSHAEENALAKITSSHENSEGAYLFVTHAPCINCAKQVANAKIKKVFYHTPYRDTSGIKYLISRGVEVEQVILTEGVLNVQCPPTNGRNQVFRRLLSFFGRRG